MHSIAKLPACKLISFDPGGTTGYAVFYSTSHIIKTGQLGPQKHHRQLEKLLDVTEPDLVITERFDYRKGQSTAELISVEYIGIMQLWCDKVNKELVRQTQLKDTKNALWTNKKLRALDLHQVARPHANDAVRQMLHFVTQQMDDYYYVEKLR